MKIHVTLFSVLALSLVACSGKDSNPAASPGAANPGPGNSGPGSDSGNANNPQTPPTVSAKSIQFQDPSDGSAITAEVNDRGDTVTVFTPPKKIQLQIAANLQSANLGFVIEDHSIRKGCKSHFEDLKASKEIMLDPAHHYPDQVESARTMYDMINQDLAYEAGYFSMKSITPAATDSLKQSALDAAHAKGFTDANRVEFSQMTDTKVTIGPFSTVLSINQENQFPKNFTRLALTTSSTRLLIGELCEILNAQEDAVGLFFVGGKKVAEAPIEITGLD